jgi:predicted O-methyltransferase YrrM
MDGVAGQDRARLPALYDRYAEDLTRVRAEQRELYERAGYSGLQRVAPYRAVRLAFRRMGFDWERSRFMNPQLDDIEAELTYLRIRERRPEVVVEVSPFRGWSTTWILRALRDNDAGSLASFDRVPDARSFVPGDLARRWTLVVGDVQERMSEMPESIDYLFIDADHRAPFAEWYLEELVPRVPAGSGASIHDIFHGSGPGRRSGEARVVLEWFEEAGIDWFTPSRFGPGRVHDEIQAQRLLLGMEEPIHSGDHDSIVFFDAPRR